MKTEERSPQKVIEQLITITNDFDFKKEKNYLLAYPYFLDYFKNLENIKLENVIIGISFTYSWMPTILKSINIQNPEVEDVISILNAVKNGNKINEEQLHTLKVAFNNSLVGTSKLLHFINPEQYAIWDSRVFRFLNEEKPHKYKLEKPKAYIEYLDFIEILKEEEEFKTFYKLMTEKVGYKITEYRALELAFFKISLKQKEL